MILWGAVEPDGCPAPQRRKGFKRKGAEGAKSAEGERKGAEGRKERKGTLSGV